MTQEIRKSLLQYLYNHPRWSRFLLYTSLVIIALPLLMSLSYYIFRDGRDDIRQTIYLQDQRFIVSLPTYIYYTNSTTYPISISQPITSNRALTNTEMRVASIDGLLATQPTSSTTTFKPDQYQSFSIPVQHDLITHGLWYDTGKIELHFEPSVSSTPETIIVTKETYVWFLLRKLLIIQSFTGGIIILLTGFLPLTIAVIEQMHKRRNEALEQTRKQENDERISLLRKALAQGDDRRSQELLPQIDQSLLDSENQAQVISFNDENFAKHIGMGKNTSIWQFAHLRFALIKAQGSAKARELTEQQIQETHILLNNIEDAHIRADLLKSLFNIILKRRNLPITGTTRAEKGGGFQVAAIQAEHDNSSFYFVRNDIDLLVEEHLDIAGFVAIAGPAGSGKTAYLRYRQDTFDRGIACMVSLDHSGMNSEQLIHNICCAFTYQIFDLLCHHPYIWLWLEEPDQEILAWFFAVYLIQNNSYLESPIRRLMSVAQSARDNTLESKTDQDACKSLSQAIQQASATLALAEQTDASAQKAARRYGLLDISTVLYNLKADQPYEILVLIDNVASQADLLLAQKVLDSTLRQPPRIIAAYAAGSLDTANMDTDIVITWDYQQLQDLIAYREERIPGHEQPKTFIADGVLDKLIHELRVPRDIWPWWAALTYARQRREASATDFLEVDWELVAPPMQQAREKRRQRAPNSPNWAMGDWQEALNMLRYASAKVYP